MKIFHLFLKNILILLLFAFVVWMSFFDENSLSRHFDIRKKITEQEKKIKDYTEQNSKFESVIDIHKTDTMNSILEKILREEYNLSKKDEIIFKTEK